VTSRQPFFTFRKQRIEDANGISIYGLTPGGVSRFRDLRICNDFCASSNTTDLQALFLGAWSRLAV